MINEDLNLFDDPTIQQAPLAPKHFKFSNEETAALEPLLKQVAHIIASAELPKSVAQHPFYPAIIQGTIRGNDRARFTKKQRNRARFVPERPDEEVVQTTLRFFAENIFDVLNAEHPLLIPEGTERATAVDGIRKALNLHLRRNLEVIAEEPIFYLGRRRGKAGREIFTSTSKIKEKHKSIKEAIDAGSLDRNKANVALLLALQAIDASEVRSKGHRRATGPNGNGGKTIDLEEYDVEELEKEISESIDWALDHSDKKLAWMNELINRYIAEKKLGGEFNRPSIKDTLRFDDLFDLIKQLFDPKTTPRDANDIQIVLNLALMHWTWVRAFSAIKRTRLKEIEKTVMESIFQKDPANVDTFLTKDTSGPILNYIDDKQDPRFETSQDCREKVPVYILKPLLSPKGETVEIYSYRMKPKPTDSGIGKHLDEGEGDLIPENISDYFRTRFVLWGKDSKNILKNEELKKKITGILHKLSEKLGIIDPTINEPPENAKYIKWQLKGHTADGVPVEIQITPHDTYLFEHAHNSGTGHKDYSELRDIYRWQVKVPPSISPIINNAFQLREAELEGKRKRTQAACKKFNYDSVTTSNR